MTTSVIGRRAMPRPVRRASRVMWLHAFASLLWMLVALSSSWQLAALLEPEVVLIFTLTYYVRRGRPWARLVSWVFFGLSAATDAVSLSGLLFTPSVSRVAATLLGFTLSCAVCLWLAAPASTEFFEARGLLTRSYDPVPVSLDPVIARQPLAAGPMRGWPAAPPQSPPPGWYPAEDLPNDQLYWDGLSWTTRRRWTAAGYLDFDEPDAALPMTARQPTVTATPGTRSSYRTAAVLVALAVVPPVVAILSLATTKHLDLTSLQLP